MAHRINQDRRRFLVTAATVIVGSEPIIFGMTKSLFGGSKGATGSQLAALRSATNWLNSAPLNADGLKGKVVLVDFWTYTCINWLRTLPYIRAWSEKYRDRGLVVIGVHTPEFGFESDLENVRRAVKALRVEYPVAIDNEYGIWRGFDNHYWPALYLMDAKGALRHQQFGEGSYDKTERWIQQLLTEAGASGIGRELITGKGQGIEAAADWENLASSENYLGQERTERFAAQRGMAKGAGHVYTGPSRLRLNEWALTGVWTAGEQAALLNEPNGRILSRFHARDLHLVLGPAKRGAPVRFRVRIDGQPPGNAHGVDVDETGAGTVTEQRLYQLIRQSRPIVDRDFEIEFLDGGVEAYAFTFG